MTETPSEPDVLRPSAALFRGVHERAAAWRLGVEETVNRVTALAMYGFDLELGENIAAIAADGFGDARGDSFTRCCAWLRSYFLDRSRCLGFEFNRDEVSLIIAARALEARRRAPAGGRR